jgi:hypothetical protein
MSNNIFVYDEESRCHLLNGVQIPSVTQIIQPLVNYFADIPNNAATFGTAVHKTIELWLLGKLDEDTLNEHLKKPLERFKTWWHTYSHVLGFMPAENSSYVEVPLYNPKLRYCGKPDLVFNEAIIDIKTRKFKPIVDYVQMAAYRGLFNDWPFKRLYVLEIDIDGDCKLVNAEHRQAYGVFRKMLDFYYRQDKFNKLLEKWKGTV